jgi:hypothetical protein
MVKRVFTHLIILIVVSGFLSLLTVILTHPGIGVDDYCAHQIKCVTAPQALVVLFFFYFLGPASVAMSKGSLLFCFISLVLCIVYGRLARESRTCKQNVMLQYLLLIIWISSAYIGGSILK